MGNFTCRDYWIGEQQSLRLIIHYKVTNNCIITVLNEIPAFSCQTEGGQNTPKKEKKQVKVPLPHHTETDSS